MKVGLENLTLVGHIKEKGDKGKQQVTYLKFLCNKMVEKGLGAIVRSQTFLELKSIRSFSHDYPRPEGTRYKKEEEKSECLISMCLKIVYTSIFEHFRPSLVIFKNGI